MNESTSRQLLRVSLAICLPVLTFAVALPLGRADIQNDKKAEYDSVAPKQPISATNLKNMLDYLDQEVRWTGMHAAALGACAAISGNDGDARGNIVVNKKPNTDCNATCSSLNISEAPVCKKTVGLSQLRATKSTSDGDVLGAFSQYGCDFVNGPSEKDVSDVSQNIIYCCCGQ